MKETFARSLKAIRAFRGITQEELAILCGTSHVIISKYETGKVMPKSEMLVSLAEALDCSLDTLCGRAPFLGVKD